MTDIKEDRKEGRVLLVDDNIENLQVLGTMLKNEGYKTAFSQDGKKALEYIKEKLPDLILLDVMMPEIDGFEVCRRLKQDRQTSEIPVIFITALQDKESRLEGFRSGGVDYITKPFIKEEVLARTRVNLQRKLAEDRLRVTIEQKDMLLREIHHRVKNNLALITSLIDLESGDVSEEKERSKFQELRGRVDSIRIIHEKLYQSCDVLNVRFRDYAAELIQDMVDNLSSGSFDLRMDIDDCIFPPKRAITLGLLIVEIVTNALKYGGHGGKAEEEGPRIEVAFSIENKEGELKIYNNGEPIPEDIENKKVNSLGLQLIDTLTEQLGGSMEIDRSGGTAFIIRFPAAESGEGCR